MRELITPSKRAIRNGRSGCGVEVCKETLTSNTYVRKYEHDITHSGRLLRQAVKQAEFKPRQCGNLRFFAPAIHTLGDDWFTMDYVHGESYAAFLLRASVAELRDFTNALLAFVEDELSASTLSPMPQEPLAVKMAALRGALVRNGYTAYVHTTNLSRLAETIPTVDIPLGPCHGDLTLSNMVVTRKGVCLLDFLDSFIDTPIMDLAKLRQDTRFRWSMCVDKLLGTHQEVRLHQALQYIDDRLRTFIVDNNLQQWYVFLERLNLLRILPYITDVSERTFVLNCIQQREDL